MKMSVTSEATTTWRGGLFDGGGNVALESSHHGPFEVNWKARSEGSTSVTTPEELLAAAHSSCFSMALSLALAQNGTPPTSIETTASVTFIPGTGITGSHLNVNAVVAGASGLIGSALTESLRDDGVRVSTLVRRAPQTPDEIEWLTGAAPLDPQRLEGADAVVGLNGASIGRFPWTKSYQHTLFWSRLTPTQELATAVKA